MINLTSSGRAFIKNTRNNPINRNRFTRSGRTQLPRGGASGPNQRSEQNHLQPSQEELLKEFSRIQSWTAPTSSRKETVAISELGTSIPTRDFPGIGASIRTSLAARARAKSSARLEMRLTRTPTAGLTSYLVTDGPISARSTVALILKRLQRFLPRMRIFWRTMFFSLIDFWACQAQRDQSLGVCTEGVP